MNKALLKGRLPRDPEISYVGAKNTALCKFQLVIPDKLAPKDREKTLWLNCTAWGGIAEVISKHVTKGQEILIVGRISFSRWEKDGQKRMDLFITVEEFEFCGNKPKEKTEEEPEFEIPF